MDFDRLSSFDTFRPSLGEPSMEANFRGVPSAFTLERAEIAAVAAAAAVRSVRHDGEFCLSA